jgi:hypothetical protein
VAAAGGALAATIAGLRWALGGKRARPPALTWVPQTPAQEYDDEPRPVDHTPVEPEPRDVRLRPALGFGLALLVFIGLVVAAVSGLQLLVNGCCLSLAPPAGGVDDPPVGIAPPEPRVDVIPRTSLESVRATEAALLDYGWADQGAGVARLPIERAMELVAERGLPVAAGAEERTYEDVVPVWPLDSSSGWEGEKLWP